MRRRTNPWLSAVLEAYEAALWRWENEREDVSYGYRTEAAMFEHEHPQPQLKDFLRTMSTAQARHDATV